MAAAIFLEHRAGVIHMGHFLQIRSLIFGAVLAAGLLITSVAQAHISLIQSIPAANAVVATPEQIDLVFNEQLLPRASHLELNILGNQESEERSEHFDIEFSNEDKTLRANLHHPLGPITTVFKGASAVR